MNLKKLALCITVGYIVTFVIADETGILDGRPEFLVFPNDVNITEAGEYTTEAAGTEFILSGTIDGDVAITASEACRVTLSNATVTGSIAVTGDAVLWLAGTSRMTTSAESVLTVSGGLLIGGTGTLAATAAGAKKVGVIAVGGDFRLAGGTTALTVAGTAKNACGVSVAGDYVQTAGRLSVTATGSAKQNGIFLATKKTKAAISGGWLTCTLAGEKSVGLAMDKGSVNGTMTGGVLRFVLSGAGAKGIKGDGSFTMNGGLVSATLTGGVVYDYFEYEDDDGLTWNYYVRLTSSTKTSGGTTTYSTSRLLANGTYPVLDPSKSYAIKVGTLAVSGGTVRVRATGTAGRGIGADEMELSGGFFDIAVSGGPTAACVVMLDEDGRTTTCLDSGSAACIKTGATDGTLRITGGKFQLAATGKAGKLINAAGPLVIGVDGQTTSPADAAFFPDIQGTTSGAKAYCAALKQKYYGSLATPVATTNLSALALSTASAKLVSGSGEDVDYSNPTGVKSAVSVAMHGGRLAIQTANDGGEGLESKGVLTVNGGLLEFVCADDCINSGSHLYINGGYVYAGSTGNDAIDSNGRIYMTGGVVLAFTATAPEVGVDTDISSGFVVDGGTLVASGSAAGNMVVGSSGDLKAYTNTGTLSGSAYGGKYLKMTGGTRTVCVKVPNMSTTSSLSLVCTTDGCTTAAPSVSAVSSPTGQPIGFHGVYVQ